MNIKQGSISQRLFHKLLRLTNKFWPEALYLKVFYYSYMGKKLDLKNPITLNEKLQWLKLHNRNPRYTAIVDKYLVKDIVAKIIGKEHIIPTLGAWDRVEDINFDTLPEKFVLKTNHSGGNTGVVICKDKAKLDKNVTMSILTHSINSTGIYPFYREWPYKDVKRKILAEQLMETSNGEDVSDYKFYCFDGNVDCVLTCIERQAGDAKFYFFDRNWELKRYNKRGKDAPEGFTLPRPKNLDKMFEIAAKLSDGLPFARVDLYNVDGDIYFGEITFYPASGVDYNRLPETDLYFGSLLSFNKAYDNIKA